MLRYAAGKQLYFDESEGVMKLIDDFASLLAKESKSAQEEQLIRLSTNDQPVTTISNIPFSHLVASYQASLKNPQATLEILARTDYAKTVREQAGIIEKELQFIDRWLEKWADDEIKFELVNKIDPGEFSQDGRNFG